MATQPLARASRRLRVRVRSSAQGAQPPDRTLSAGRVLRHHHEPACERPPGCRRKRPGKWHHHVRPRSGAHSTPRRGGQLGEADVAGTGWPKPVPFRGHLHHAAGVENLDKVALGRYQRTRRRSVSTNWDAPVILAGCWTCGCCACDLLHGRRDLSGGPIYSRRPRRPNRLHRRGYLVVIAGARLFGVWWRTDST